MTHHSDDWLLTKPNELPKGWVKTKLGEVCLPVATIQPKDSPDAEFTYFDIGGIDNERNRIAQTKIVTGPNAPSRARQAVRKEDILFSNVRTYLRKIARVELDYSNPVASTGFTVIRAAEGVSSQFLFFQILSEDFLQPLHALQTGSSYPAVRKRDVLSQPILLAPAQEQKRIAAKLDVALTRIMNGEKAAHRALQRLVSYRAAVLHAAVTGELTREWRKAQLKKKKAKPETGEALLQRLLKARRTYWEEAEWKRLNTSDKVPKDDKWKLRYHEPSVPSIAGLPGLTEGWVWASPEQLSSGDRHALSIGPFGSNLKVSDYRDSGVPLIFVQNIRTGVFLGESTRYISHDKAQELKPHQATGGDILITKMGDPPGDACLYPESAPTAVITADCIRLKLSRLIDKSKSFLVHSINSRLVRDQIRQITKGVAQQKMSLFRFSSIALPLPPLSEQTKIAREVDRRLSAAGRLAIKLEQQLTRARALRQSLLREAFAGRLVQHDPDEEPAAVLLERLRSDRTRMEAVQHKAKSRSPGHAKTSVRKAMKKSLLTPAGIAAAFSRIGHKANADRLFKEVGCTPDEVTVFYETLRVSPEVRRAFEQEAAYGPSSKNAAPTTSKEESSQKGRFRLVELWLEDFKNLKDYSVRFDSTHGLDVVLGWNGTGKSNLFEALVIIFRDLHGWWERNRWPEQPMNGYRLRYEIDEQLIDILWNPKEMKRPVLTGASRSTENRKFGEPEAINRTQLALPRFVFGYYSGPTNRLAEHFQPMKQAHYVRLREATSDDSQKLAALLEQRRFFCAETHHAKYVLLAFFYREDAEISNFLRERLRITGFESALFIIRKPRWAKPGAKAHNFWGAKGVMRRVLERLRHFAIAPMVIEQTVNDGYRTSKEDHYYFFLPDLSRLHSFASEYDDARTFFLALESTDFSELIYDVKIQVRVSVTNSEEVPITFREMSEGEQQLLMVLGLLRFTKSFQSLVLLDEPDTHLNPHWSVDYVKLLTKVMTDDPNSSEEQQTSQILISTHDPLVIASLVKEQVYLMIRDSQTGACKWVPASVNPRGLGFTGILTSEMFGFRSDLDEETLADLDNKVRLMAKEGDLGPAATEELEGINIRLSEAGFQKAFSDPYYAAFVRAWGRKYSELMASQQFLSEEQKKEIERVAHEVLEEAIAEVENKVDG